MQAVIGRGTPGLEPGSRERGRGSSTKAGRGSEMRMHLSGTEQP